MNEQLYIEDQLIDLYPSTRIALTLQVNDLAELKDRQASRTNRFKIPRTATNELALEFSSAIQSTTSRPYRRLRARYMVGSLPVFRRGYAIVMGSDDSDYEIMLTDASADFFAAIDGKYLTDLDLSDYNHTWQLSDIVAAAGNTDGYIYPVAAFTDNSSYISDGSATIDIRRSVPFVYFKTILDRILSGVGFGLTAGTDNYFNSGHFSRLVLQAGVKGLVTTGKIIHATHSVDQNIFNGNVLTPETRAVFFDTSSGGDPVARTGNFDVYGDWTGSKHFDINRDLKVPSGFGITATLQYTIDQLSPTANPETWMFSFWYYNGSTWRQCQDRATVSINASESKAGTVTFQISEDEFLSASGGYLICAPSIDNSNVPADRSDLNIIAAGSFLEAFEYNREISFGEPVTLAGNMPKITQKDFLKGVAQMVGGIFDVKDGKLSLITFDSIRDKRATAQDWTEKVNTKGKETSFVVGGYGQASRMKYKGDDAVSSGRGDGTLTVDDETIQAEKDLFTLPWAGSDNGTYLGGKSIPQVYVFDSGGDRLTTQPRVLYMDFDEVYTDAVSFTDGSTTTPIAVPPYCHFIHPELSTLNLGFDKSLIADYYSGLVSVLNKSRVIEVLAKLSEVDMINLDLFTPVYLQSEGGYFYINKVSNWLPGRLTKVELIRL